MSIYGYEDFEVTDWDFTENDAPQQPARERNTSLRPTDRDFQLVDFLARYYFASLPALTALTGTSAEAVDKRLRKLRSAGLVEVEGKGHHRYWFPTADGMQLFGLPFPAIPPSYQQLHHTVAVAELAAELEAEHGLARNVLGETPFPVRLRPASGERLIQGKPALNFGHVVISEREIQQAQQRESRKAGWSFKEAREEVREVAKLSESIEALEGQEHLFVLYGDGGQQGMHRPDAVVTVTGDGVAPHQHIAIEFERTMKKTVELDRILRAYRDHAYLYGGVIYFTPSPAIKRAVEAEAGEERVGLPAGFLTVRKFSPSTLIRHRP